jgi:hypothetical protein
MVLTYCHIRLRLECMTPLGRDSVPLVYIRRSTWSSSTTALGAGVVVVSHCAKSCHPAGARCPPVSATLVKALLPSPAARMASSAAGISSGSTINPVAPLCRRMYAISWAVSMKLRGTSTTGARAVANASTAYCQQLCASNAMRSEGPNPLSRRAAAARSTVMSKSANVIVMSPSMIATLSGVRRAERRGMSPMLWLRALGMRSSGPAFTWGLPVACLPR